MEAEVQSYPEVIFYLIAFIGLGLINIVLVTPFFSVSFV